MRFLSLSRFALLLPLVATLAACGGKTEPKADDTAKPFCMTDSLLAKSRLVAAEVTAVDNETELSGKVTFDEEKVNKVFPLLSGVVEEVKVELGDQVTKGQVLAVVQSSDVAGFSGDVLVARANVAQTKRVMDAAAEMLKSGLGSEKDYVLAQGEYEKALTTLERARSVLSINGGNGGDAKGNTYTIKAPAAGYVVEKTLTAGMQIRSDAGNSLFTISGLQDVWVMANVYESDIAKVHEGDAVKIKTLAYPDQVFTGKVNKISTMLDPTNKVMRARIVMQNTGLKLKPEMFATVIADSRDGSKMLAIPKEALVFDNSKNYVMVFREKCKIETHLVEVAKVVEGKAYIKSGLAAGDKVIIGGQLYIYQEVNNQ